MEPKLTSAAFRLQNSTTAPEGDQRPCSSTGQLGGQGEVSLCVAPATSGDAKAAGHHDFLRSVVKLTTEE